MFVFIFTKLFGVWVFKFLNYLRPIPIRLQTDFSLLFFFRFSVCVIACFTVSERFKWFLMGWMVRIQSYYIVLDSICEEFSWVWHFGIYNSFFVDFVVVVVVVYNSSIKFRKNIRKISSFFFAYNFLLSISVLFALLLLVYVIFLMYIIYRYYYFILFYLCGKDLCVENFRLEIM